MNNVTLGNHSKIVARRAEQERIRAFYCEILGCTLTKRSDEVDFIRFADGTFMAVLYQEQVASAEALRQAIWLELRTRDAAALTKRNLAFGVHRIEIPGAEHLYFQAPGGQVYRVVTDGEDLTRFEK